MKTGVLILMILVLISYTAFADDGELMHPRNLSFDMLEWDIPDVERVELSNGMIVYLQPDSELPIIDVHAFIRTGEIYEPADKLGLASVTGEVMRTGGINPPNGEKRSGDEIDEEIEFLAARLEMYTHREYFHAFLTILEKDIAHGFELFRDILMYPAFDEKKIELQKDQEIEEIRRQNDNPQRVAFREWVKLIYGTENPWARTPTIETVSSITREDAMKFHQTYFHPNNIILAVFGDFEPEEMKQKLENTFKDWQKEDIDFPEIEPVDHAFEPKLYFLPKNQNQSTIVMGHLGIRRNNPDYFPVLVMNEILGGGFTSRMLTEVRSNRGLSYSAYSQLNEGTDYGIFYAYCATKTNTTLEAIQVMTDVVESMLNQPPTDDELQLAKSSILNSFVFQFDGRAELVRRLMLLEFYGQPADFYETYRQNVAKVTKADVQRVAQEFLHPDAMKTLVVGNEAVKESLNTLGNVIELKNKE